MSFTSSQDSNASNETFGKDASFKLPQLIGAMSISPAGRDVVLGSKEGLHIIDLDSPYSPPRFLPHRTPWEVADVQWSPFADRDYWVVSTSNQKALVWNLDAYGWRDSIEHVLHGHTRAITDINFSAFHPDKLATCAVDSFVHCWDLRSPSRPAYSFSDWFAGATQVKWSRQDEHVIASSHDKYLHIWDDRKGAYPLRTIQAHDAKIYGIDWNRFEPSKIVTCSLDKTVKFWDTNNSENVPDRIIETTFPVSRARHTPFGWGLMVMPQRGSGDLHLYDRRNVGGHAENRPVNVFSGHKGQVKEFLWRAMGDVRNGIDHRDFQLVSWGTDHELRLHAVQREVFEDIGYEKGVSKPQRLRFTRRGARYRTFRDEPSEQDFSSTPPPRADSFPTSNQFLRVRGRPSTNMGMNRVPIAHFKGWLQAGKNSKRTDMHGRGAAMPDADPLSWMKNVKIASWDTDALADELTLIGEKFAKVEFEILNVSRRKAVLSLQGPWHEIETTPVYIRIDFRFPKGYPREAPAIVNVQKISSVTPATQKHISSDVQQITEAYRARGRGCVEAIVRYLLREQDAEQIITAVTRENLTDSRIINAAETSFDVSDDSDDDQLGLAASIVQPDAQVNVPLAKGCAALWAENGQLVCFFRRADKEPASLLSTLGTGDLDEPEASKLFGGFGKFQVTSQMQKPKEGQRNDDVDSSDSEGESSSERSTSSSSSASSLGFEDRSTFTPWQRPGIDSLQRSKSAEGSQKSTLVDSTRAGAATGKAIIAIYDCSDLLPASRMAATEYSLGPDMLDSFKRNAEIATQHNMREAATIWRLAMSMTNESNVTELAHLRKEDPSLSLLAFAINMLTSQQPAHDRGMPEVAEYCISPPLMRYCEERCDVQMLATLSMIYLSFQLGEIRCRPELLDVSKFWTSTYHTSVNSARDISRHSVPSSTSGSQLSYSTRALADDGPRSSTANWLTHNSSRMTSAINSQSVSLATSPESSRLSRRSELASSYSNATSNTQALRRARPPSPQAHSYRQPFDRRSGHKSLHGSPDDRNTDSSKSMLRSSLSLANVSGYGGSGIVSKQVERLQPVLKNQSSNASSKKVGRKRLKTSFIKSTAKKASVVSPVLHPAVFERCLHYIQQYLPLLEVWQLWVQRAQFLKIHHQVSVLLEKVQPKTSSLFATSQPDLGLTMRRCCPRCESTLGPIEKNGIAIGWQCLTSTCASAQIPKPSIKQRCAICEMVVSGLIIPCLQCRHLTCFNCAQDWFASDQPLTPRSSSLSSSVSKEGMQEKTDKRSCPTGCGCPCPSLSKITIPEPKVEVIEVDRSSLFTPTTTISEDFQDGTPPFQQTTERRKNRGQSIGDVAGIRENSAINALLVLNVQSRHRATSSTGTAATAKQIETEQSTAATASQDSSMNAVDELLPWAGDANATLGRGYGRGLSRGLSNKSSNSTIRRASRRD